jgi:hypothetical protein
MFLVCTSYLEAKAHNNLLQNELQRFKAFNIIEHQVFRKSQKATNRPPSSHTTSSFNKL